MKIGSEPYSSDFSSPYSFPSSWAIAHAHALHDDRQVLLHPEHRSVRMHAARAIALPPSSFVPFSAELADDSRQSRTQLRVTRIP